MTPNLVKPFTIAGFILGELYMVLMVLSPEKAGMEVPWTGVVGRLVGYALFFGPFGAAAGMGVGMLVMLVITLIRRARSKSGSDQQQP